MRILLALFILMIVVPSAFAQGVPTSITYQGRLTDSQNHPVPDGSREMEFTLFDAESEGNQLWDSGTMTVATSGGVFTVVLQPISPSVLAGGCVLCPLHLEPAFPSPPRRRVSWYLRSRTTAA